MKTWCRFERANAKQSVAKTATINEAISKHGFKITRKVEVFTNNRKYTNRVLSESSKLQDYEQTRVFVHHSVRKLGADLKELMPNKVWQRLQQLMKQYPNMGLR